VDLAQSDDAAAAEAAAGAARAGPHVGPRSHRPGARREQPERAEAYLQEAGSGAEAVRLVAGAMARSIQSGRFDLLGSAEGEEQQAALAAVAAALAATDPDRAARLAGEIAEGEWRELAVEAVAERLARTNPDAATGLLGLIAYSDRVPAIRAQVAIEVHVATRRPRRSC